ncbi:MAG: phosphate-binding protein [Melioribacteraceae bacterium]|nr:MAG: phosphate-binding protein [Melioribacteraceae bacterium]
MVNLTQKWAETYMKKFNDLSIHVTGGGSGTGVAALLNGTASIANISRELKEREYKNAHERGIEPYQIKVALDGIAIIVNPENNIDTLLVEQVRDIFSGKIRYWSEVGGAEERIVLYGRENSSGTYEYFKNIILDDKDSDYSIDFATSTQVLQGTSALGEAVALDKRGIGYGGVGYFVGRKDLKIIHIKEGDSKLAVSPTHDGELNYEIIRNGEYPLARYLYCFTNGEPKEGALKDYIDFILSAEGQSIVEQMEYIPLIDFSKDEQQ